MAKGEKLSSSFGGASTKGFKSVDREVEARLARLDVFTDDFSPPGTSDAFNGGDFKKPGFGKKAHEDYSSDEDNSRNHSKSFKPMSLPRDREKEQMDKIDSDEYRFENIVKDTGGLPGVTKGKKMAEKFDDHAVDPAKLKSSDGPDALNKKVEAKLAKLASNSFNVGSQKFTHEDGEVYFEGAGGGQVIGEAKTIEEAKKIATAWAAKNKGKQ